MKFGGYSIAEPITHFFEKEPTWWWRVMPITSGHELEIQKFSIINRIVTDMGGQRHEFPPTIQETAYREIALTFGGCNITHEMLNADGKGLLLESGAGIAEIEAVLRDMPQAMVDELWKAVGDANPTWGPPRIQPVVADLSATKVVTPKPKKS